MITIITTLAKRVQAPLSSIIMQKEIRAGHKIAKLTAQNIGTSDNDYDYILQLFKNVPSRPSSTGCTWSGDIAQFIYDNLI